MNIAEAIYQHVKVMPKAKALEVLQFVEFIETTSQTDLAVENDMVEFMKSLPVHQNRSDLEINQRFQLLRDEWDKP